MLTPNCPIVVLARSLATVPISQENDSSQEREWNERSSLALRSQAAMFMRCATDHLAQVLHTWPLANDNDWRKSTFALHPGLFGVIHPGLGCNTSYCRWRSRRVGPLHNRVN
jgi:hypothetical protein